MRMFAGISVNRIVRRDSLRCACAQDYLQWVVGVMRSAPWESRIMTILWRARLRAVMTASEIKIIWKIDYNDASLCYHSPDSSNRNITSRVMTIMRADEY